MKRIRIKKHVNLPRLIDELLAVFPEWKEDNPVDPLIGQRSDYLLMNDEQLVDFFDSNARKFKFLEDEPEDPIEGWGLSEALGKLNQKMVTITKNEITFHDSTDERRVKEILTFHQPYRLTDSQDTLKIHLSMAREHVKNLRSAEQKLRNVGLTDDEIKALRRK